VEKQRYLMEKRWRVFKVISNPDNIRTNRRQYAIAVMIILYEFSVAVITCTVRAAEFEFPRVRRIFA